MTLAEKIESPAVESLKRPSPRLDPTADGHHRFSREDYQALAENGIFNGQRVELIDGEIFQMSPQDFPHVSAISNINQVFVTVFGKDFWLLNQSNIHLLEASAPEPDFAVVPNEFRRQKVIPSAALLVVEVSKTTLRYDREVKAAVYAAAGVPEYWIVNLVDLVLEVHRDPVPDSTARFGKSYGSIQRLTVAGTVRPLAKPKAEIKIVDLMP